VFFLLSVSHWTIAYNSIEQTVGTLQREPEHSGGNSRAVKCFINYIWCYTPCQRWKQWFYSELLYKSTALQTLLCWSILRYSHATLFHFHSGMSLSTLTNHLVLKEKKRLFIFVCWCWLLTFPNFKCTCNRICMHLEQGGLAWQRYLLWVVCQQPSRSLVLVATNVWLD